MARLPTVAWLSITLFDNNIWKKATLFSLNLKICHQLKQIQSYVVLTQRSLTNHRPMELKLGSQEPRLSSGYAFVCPLKLSKPPIILNMTRQPPHKVP